MQPKYPVHVIFRRLDREKFEEHRWEAHVLELNVVTYGKSLGHAIDMAVEAAEMVIHDDLSAGEYPLRPLRRADPEDWAAYQDIRQRALEKKGGAAMRTLQDVLDDPRTETEATFSAVAVELFVTYRLGDDELLPKTDEGPERQVAPAFQDCA